MPSSIWAHGVVVSHPLSMREALGSIPSVSICVIKLTTPLLTLPVASNRQYLEHEDSVLNRVAQSLCKWLGHIPALREAIHA